MYIQNKYVDFAFAQGGSHLGEGKSSIYLYNQHQDTMDQHKQESTLNRRDAAWPFTCWDGCQDRPSNPTSNLNTELRSPSCPPSRSVHPPIHLPLRGEHGEIGEKVVQAVMYEAPRFSCACNDHLTTTRWVALGLGIDAILRSNASHCCSARHSRT